MNINIDEIKEMIAEEIDVDVERIDENSHFVDDLDASSVDLIQVIFNIEEKYDLQIPNEKIPDLTSIMKIKEFLCEQPLV